MYSAFEAHFEVIFYSFEHIFSFSEEVLRAYISNQRILSRKFTQNCQFTLELHKSVNNAWNVHSQIWRKTFELRKSWWETKPLTNTSKFHSHTFNFVNWHFKHYSLCLCNSSVNCQFGVKFLDRILWFDV